jgi:uncharacterized membrane protein
LAPVTEGRIAMRGFGRFLLATLVRGVLFLLPVTLIAVLTRETYQAFLSFTRPLAALLPVGPVFGVLFEEVLAIVLIALAFLLAGLFVGTRPGRALSDYLERLVLYRVPGYLLVRGAASGVPGLQLGSAFTPVLVRTGEGWTFALLVEPLPPGFCTVFIPDAPTPTSGSVVLVEDQHVRALDASVLSLMGCLTRSGVGAGKLASAALTGLTHGTETSECRGHEHREADAKEAR